MKIHKLTLENFRQFKGKNTMVFSSDNDKNVTVIFGENGRGKTGIFRGIMFNLFGDRKLPQDGDVDISEIHLVNSTAICEDEKHCVSAKVILEFSHKNNRYELEREITGILTGNGVIEQSRPPILKGISQDGNSNTYNGDQAQQIIENIISKMIKGYFLFDGEKIERLTRRDTAQTKEVKDGIRNLLDIDVLEKAEKALRKLSRDCDTEMSKNSSPELQQLYNYKKVLEDENAKLEGDKDIRTDELNAATNLRNDLDKKLRSISNIKELIEQRKKTENSLSTLRKDQANYNENARKNFIDMMLLMLKPTIEDVFKEIDDKKKRGEIPSNIRRDLIDKILEDGICICGNNLKKGSEAYKKILDWYNKVDDTKTQDAELDLWNELSKVISQENRVFHNVQNLLLDHQKCTESLEEQEQYLKNIRTRLGENDRQDAVEWENQRDCAQQQIDLCNAELITITNKIRGNNDELESIKIKIDNAMKSINKENIIRRKSDISNQAYSAIQKIKEDFIKDIRVKIENKTWKIFEKLIDRQVIHNLSKISIDKDYSLQILDTNGNPFLANISAGMRQILSIAFIAALANIASNNTLYEMPIFMDTPFGRLSGVHRKNLMIQTPKLCSQWVILATDTEFSKNEAEFLCSTKCWGNFYILENNGEGNTNILSKNIDESFGCLSEAVFEKR